MAAHLIPAAPARPVPIARPRHLSPARARAHTRVHVAFLPSLPRSLVPPVASPSFLPVTPGPGSRAIVTAITQSQINVTQRLPNLPPLPGSPGRRRCSPTALVATVRRTLVVVRWYRYSAPRVPSFLTRRAGVAVAVAVACPCAWRFGGLGSDLRVPASGPARGSGRLIWGRVRQIWRAHENKAAAVE